MTQLRIKAWKVEGDHYKCKVNWSGQGKRFSKYDLTHDIHEIQFRDLQKFVITRDLEYLGDFLNATNLAERWDSSSHLAVAEILWGLKKKTNCKIIPLGDLQAPVGPTSWPQYPPTSRESAEVGVSGQREKGDADRGGRSLVLGIPLEASLLPPKAPPRFRASSEKAVRDE